MEKLDEMKNDDAYYDDTGFPLRRRRRTRTVFTAESISLMEEQFNRNRYPDILRREYLAEQIGVSEARVQVWFQNRRARCNKQFGLPDGTLNELKQETSDVYNSGVKTGRKHRSHSKDFTKCKPKFNQRVVPSANKMTSEAAVRAYINQHQMYFPYKHVTPHLRNPFMTFLPLNQFARAPDIHLKIPSLLHYPESKSTYSKSSQDTVKEDNIVERLFRFSAPSYKQDISNANKAEEIKQKYFHGISRLKYPVENIPTYVNEANIEYDEEFEHSTKIPESYEPFQGEVFEDDRAHNSRAESSDGSDGSTNSDSGSVSY